MHRSLQRKISILVGMNAAGVNKQLEGIKARLAGLKRIGVSAFRYIGLGATIAAGALGFLLKSIIKTGAEFERFEVQLSVLFGSMEKGREKFAWIKEFAKATPYELAQIVEATAKLKATGLEAENVLKDLGDLASSAQKPLEQVVMAVSNIASGMLGIGMKQLRLLNINNKMMEEQGIIFNNQGSIMNSSTEVIDALQRIIKERFSGMMEETAKTMFGVISNIKDAWTQIKAAIAEKINPVVKRELQKLQTYAFWLLDSGKIQEYADLIGRTFIGIFNKVRMMLPKILSFAKQIIDFVTPPIKFLIDNPGIVKTAAIVLVMGKVLQLTYLWSKALMGVGGYIAGKLVPKLGELALKMGLASAAAQTAGTAGGAAAGAAGTAATAGAAGTAGAALLATIIPYVVAALGAAAVGYAIYKLVDRYNTRVDRQANAVTETRAKLTDVTDKANSARDLWAEYKRLYPVTEKTADQQKRYNEVVRDLGKIFPDAVMKTNDFGEAVVINANKVDAGTKALQDMAAATQRLLKQQTEDLLANLPEDIKDFDINKFGRLQEMVAKFESPNPISNPLADIMDMSSSPFEQYTKDLTKLEDQLRSAKATMRDFMRLNPEPNSGAMGTKIDLTPTVDWKNWNDQKQNLKKDITDIEDKIKDFKVQKFPDLHQKMKVQADIDLEMKVAKSNFLEMESDIQSKLKKLTAAFPDITNESIAGDFRAFLRSEVSATEDELARWYKLLKEYQDKLRAPILEPKQKKDDSAHAKMLENQMKSEEALAEFQKTMRTRQEKIDDAYFDTKISRLNEYDQERRKIERQYQRDMKKLNENTFIFLDHGNEQLQKEQNDLTAKISATNTALAKAQKDLSENKGGAGTSTLVNSLRAQMAGLEKAQAELYNRMREASPNYQKAASGFSTQRTESIGLIGSKEIVDKEISAAEEVKKIREDLTKQKEELQDREIALSLSKENDYYQGYMGIIRKGEQAAQDIIKQATDGKIGFVEAWQLASEQSELARQQAVMATLEETAALEKEIFDSQRDARLKGYEIDYITREEWAIRANELLSTLREEDFTNHEAYLTAKQRLEDIASGKQIGKQKIYWKLMKNMTEAGFTTLFEAGKLWASGEIKLRDALKVAALQSVSDIVAGSLEAQGKQWAIEAAAAAAKLNFAEAAGLAAAAAAAGVASGWIRARAQASIDAVKAQYEDKNQGDVPDLGGSDNATRVSGYTTSGVRDVYIQPSVTIQGETVLVGTNGSVDDAGEAIGKIAVRAVKDAVETGELTL